MIIFKMFKNHPQICKQLLRFAWLSQSYKYVIHVGGSACGHRKLWRTVAINSTPRKLLLYIMHKQIAVHRFNKRCKTLHEIKPKTSIICNMDALTN